MFHVFLAALTLAAVAPSPSPSPSPTAKPALKEIGRTKTRGRIENLLGKANSASEGNVGYSELEARPILRPGELLETIPGVVISQHSGEGKANQYYLRGFNLDHGTDIAITIGGIPANMRTHAHGQGYSDINWLIPELVSYVNYRKGPYFADEGDFSTAGAVNMYYFDTLPHNIMTVGGGPYGQARVFVAASPKLGRGNLLYAAEYLHEDNTAMDPDNYRKYNAFLRYSQTTGTSNFNVTGQMYQAKWQSSDQIALRAVQQGIISRFGELDPTDGGKTHRYALSADWVNDTGKSVSKAGVYGMDYKLNLFSNFTYFLEDPVRGDQFEQSDQRLVTGANLSQTWRTPVAENTIGYQFRNDNIAPVGLFHTQYKQVLGTKRLDHVVETSNAVYLQTEQHFTKKFRVTAGIRGDLYRFRVKSLRPENSGDVIAGLMSPKVSFAYETSPRSELYLNLGESYHSNDGRGVTERVDPVTGSHTDPSGFIIEGATPLVRAIGQELGLRFALSSRLRTTVSFWNLDLGSELVFSGDAGTTTPGRPSQRSGIELANFFVPSPGVTIDADFSTSSARFTNFDPIGQHIPGSLQTVGTFGLTVDRPKSFGSIRMRYFGPRPLIEDASVFSKPTTTVSLQAGIRPTKDSRLSLDVFNLLNTKASDIDYYYNSSLRSDPPSTFPANGGAGVPDVHFHPIEKRLLRLTFSKQF